MTIGGDALHWTFTLRTPLGETHCSFEIDADVLRFESDGPLGSGVDSRHWSSIGAGGTAAMAGMGGPGSPDLPGWVPAQMEWLILSGGREDGKPFMRVLPAGAQRDDIVAAVRQRLGPRWLGERLPLQEAQARLGVSSSEWSTLKVVGLVVAVLALLVVLIILLSLLLHPVIAIPAGFLAGGWLFRKGLHGLRDGLAVANTPTAKASSAALGLVELAGRAVTAQPSIAPVTGRPSVWWDVAIHLWYEDGRNNGEWRQVAARHGGDIGVVEFVDDTGRIPVWLKGADLLLEAQVWESRKDALPSPGTRLLDELGFPWSGNQRIRVSETCLEANGAVYVIGTLDERRNLPAPGDTDAIERFMASIRTGEWRHKIVASAPGPAKIVVAVLISFLDMFCKIGTGGERARGADDSSPPDIAPAATVVWKGRAGRPFLVSNRPEPAALTSLRQRSLLFCGAGAVVLCYTLYELVEFAAGT
ncbi:MAG: hypothetical protein V9E93_17835 [Steroidobacteraceae bacterium]|nr:hypothetical protein [Pseudomonadota bacterium]MBP7014500.1 hypothetical protein [Steroidobacteraceae bacterium]